MKERPIERGLFEGISRSVTPEDYKIDGREAVEQFLAETPGARTVDEYLSAAKRQALEVYKLYEYAEDQAPSIDSNDWPPDFYFAHRILNGIYHVRRLLKTEHLSQKDTRELVRLVIQLASARVKLRANARHWPTVSSRRRSTAALVDNQYMPPPGQKAALIRRFAKRIPAGRNQAGKIAEAVGCTASYVRTVLTEKKRNPSI